MKAMVIKESDGEKFIGKLSSLVKIVYTVGTAVIGIIVWLMVMRSDVNANTKSTSENKKAIEKVNDKFDTILEKLNEIKIQLEKKEDRK
jgi:uncharacterized membrane protein YciS (DUF1049 family)